LQIGYIIAVRFVIDQLKIDVDLKRKIILLYFCSPKGAIS